MVAKVARFNAAAVEGDGGAGVFFSAVEGVRTGEGSGAFNAVRIGGGDRTTRNSIDNDDRLYMLRDNGIARVAADRTVEVAIDEVRETPAACALRFELVEPSPVNPPLSRAAARRLPTAHRPPPPRRSER